MVEMQLQGLAGDVEIDLREHVVAGHEQSFEGMDSAMADADTPASVPRILYRLQDLEQSLKIVNAVLHAAIPPPQ